MDNVETPVMTFSMRDDTNTTHVTTTRDHCNRTGVEFDEIGDLSRREVDLDGIVDLDNRIWVSDPTLTHFISILIAVLFPTKHWSNV